MINDNADKVMHQADSKIPARRFPEFKNSPPWQDINLSKIVDYENGKAHEDSVVEIGKYTLVNSKFISTAGIVIKYTNTGRCVAQKNDILIVLSDIPNGRAIAKCYFVERNDFYTVNQRICKLTAINTIAKFLFYILDRNKYFLKFDDGAKQTNLRKEDVLGFNLIIPIDNEEQEKIAACLSSVDALTGKKQTELESLKKYKKGLLQQLFPQCNNNLPALRFPEFHNLLKWEIKRVKEISENLDNQRVPITSSQRVKGEIPYYGASGIIDFVDGFIFDDDLLCISEDGANLIMRTAPIAFSVSGKTWINNHAHVLKFKYKATQILVENYLNSIKLDDFLTGMAQPKLNKAMLDSIPICLPTSPEEQKKIADCLTSLDNLIDLKQQELDKLSHYKKGLLQQLLVQG